MGKGREGGYSSLVGREGGEGGEGIGLFHAWREEEGGRCGGARVRDSKPFKGSGLGLEVGWGLETGVVVLVLCLGKKAKYLSDGALTSCEQYCGS